MATMTRVRWVFARRPMLWWALVALLAAAAAGIAVQAVQSVEAARRSWGATQQVWIVETDTPAGEQLTASARDYPLAMVPADAVRSDPRQVNARRHLAAGEILVAEDVTSSGIAGLMPADTVSIGIPVRRSPHLTVGAAVIAYANGASIGKGTVVAVDDEQVIVAVNADAAAALTMAVPSGAVIVGLVP